MNELWFKEKWWKKMLFFQSHSIKSVSQWEECVCSVQSPKEWKLLHESMFVLFDRWILTRRKMVERKALLTKSKHQTMYPNKENVFIVPKHQKNGDYYENPSLSHLRYEFWFLGKWRDEKLLIAKTLISYILMRKMCLWCPVTKRMEIIMRIHVCLTWWMNFDSSENGERKSI